MRKNRPKTSVIAKKAIFWNVCFYQPLGSQRNVIIICTINVKTPCGLFFCVPRHFSCSIKREKIGQNLFFAGKAAFFFLKHCFSNNLLGPKKGFYRFHRVCQISLWTLLKRWVTFFMFDKTRKNRPKAISHYKDCLFSPKLRVFNNLLGPKKWTHKFKSTCQNLFVTVLYCSLRFFTCDITRKDWPKTFVIVKTPIFEMFVSIDRSGPKGIILSFAK